ncbi:ODV-E25 [Diatraea saccharalis granulovirus]|uniref:ODV-E25 n=1 Tax=Diatraea saccharalis granulovirus TaxID=1675862 RepID=A0A0R7EZ59_9BBAC|nr:ODV-E25 [Diatraea saccharalis granulovirus]AKN80807.1 ODV-E25 [Diatraea saccharalis granulovirus]
MLGTIVLLLVIGAVLYLLWANDKLNTNSLNDSQSDSLQFRGEDKTTFTNNNTKLKNVRIAHGEKNFSKVSVLETPTRYEQIVEKGDRVGANSVFLGILESPFGGVDEQQQRTTNNLVIKRFKNMFIVFKGIKYYEIDNNPLMVRYETEDKMVFALIDASNNTIPELLRDVSYPICVLSNNPSTQLVLKEWGFTQINDAATLFVKNENSFRLQ